MSSSGLSAAHRSILRKLFLLADAWREGPDAGVDPEAALNLCLALDARVGNLITGIALLRHEANTVTETRKATV